MIINQDHNAPEWQEGTLQMQKQKTKIKQLYNIHLHVINAFLTIQTMDTFV